MTKPPLVLVAAVVAGLACPSARAQTCDDVDTDLDGLPDAAERVLGTDVDRADTDGDGLTDLEELTADVPTSPREVDTDGDGYCDGTVALEGRCALRAPGDEPDPCGAPVVGAPRQSAHGVSGTHILGCAAGPAPASIGGLALILLTVRRRQRHRPRPAAR